MSNEEISKSFDSEENLGKRQENNVEKYEDILAFAKMLKEQGFDPFEHEDYTDSPNPAVVAVWERYENWQGSHNLSIRYITTVEKATATVQAAFFWIDAGFTDKKVIKEALERLVLEERDVDENPDSSDEIKEILSKAVEKLEGMLSENKPEKKISALVERAVSEANEKVEKGDLMDAVRLLTSTLHTNRFQKFFKKNPEKQNEITMLRDSIREKWRKS